MGPMRHHVSFIVAGGESHNKPVAVPAPDAEEESISAETGHATDAEVETSAQTSNTGTNPQHSAMDITDA